MFFFFYRYATIWGGASLLQMILSAFHEILAIFPDFDYVMNFSEADLPLIPIENLTAYLSFYQVKQKIFLIFELKLRKF